MFLPFQMVIVKLQTAQTTEKQTNKQTCNYVVHRFTYVTDLPEQPHFVYNDLHEAFPTIEWHDARETLMKAQIVLAALELLFELQTVILHFLHNPLPREPEREGWQTKLKSNWAVLIKYESEFCYWTVNFLPQNVFKKMFYCVV